jgi:hypothetical protein
VRERPELLALIPPGGWGRRGVGRLAWLLLGVFASLSSVTATYPGEAPSSHPPGLEARMAAPRRARMLGTDVVELSGVRDTMPRRADRRAAVVIQEASHQRSA